MENLTITKLFKYLVLIILLANFGCSESTESSMLEMADEEMPLTLAAPKARELGERKFIKDGNLSFETENLNKTREAILEAVHKYSGYVSSDWENKTPGRISNTLMIRIPEKNFDNLLEEISRGVEKFESKAINIQDVTEEFVDIEARLKTKKELEARYSELLKEAKNVTEMLEIEKQMGELRADIESIEGRLKYLQDKVSYATLSVTFYESLPEPNEFGQKFKNGFKKGWENLIWFFIVLTNIWPFLLIILGLIFGLGIYLRKK